MNPVKERIGLRLDDFPEELAPLRDTARRYLRHCSAIEVDDTVLIGQTRWNGPLAYAFRLYPPAKKTWCELSIPHGSGGNPAEPRYIWIPAKNARE
ncbi:MAG: hypothetical protein AB9873_10955 [Syntrophobacteraceae bacterium]